MAISAKPHHFSQYAEVEAKCTIRLSVVQDLPRCKKKRLWRCHTTSLLNHRLPPTTILPTDSTRNTPEKKQLIAAAIPREKQVPPERVTSMTHTIGISSPLEVVPVSNCAGLWISEMAPLPVSPMASLRLFEGVSSTIHCGNVKGTVQFQFLFRFHMHWVKLLAVSSVKITMQFTKESRSSTVLPEKYSREAIISVILRD